MAEKTPVEQQPQPAEPPQPPPPPQPPSRPKVKSYLHKFYDHSSSVKDPALYEPGGAEEGDELRRLLNSGRSSKPRGCHLRPVAWKAMLWIGVNCLIFGALGLAIAFFLPHEPELYEVKGTQRFMRSQVNADWNRSASVLKYVALGIFGVGALVTAAGLVLPSLVWRLFDDDEAADAGGGGGLCGQSLDSGCCSRGKSGGGTEQNQRQQPAVAPATVTSSAAATAGGGTAATTSEAPALSSLVDERAVQPARSPEGHVSHGQVK